MSSLGSNRLRWLLIGSLALNLFLGGIYVGHWVGAWRGGPDGAAGHVRALRFHLRPMLENLPEASREQAEAVMERHRDPIRGAVRAMRQSRREVRDALLAEPVDEARLDRALAETRERAAASQAAMHAAMTEFARELPPEARRKLAENLGRHGRRGHHSRPRPPRE